MILMVFMASSLLASLRNERRQMELHEVLLRERLQRLLDEHEAPAATADAPVAAHHRSRSAQLRMAARRCLTPGLGCSS